MLRLVESFVYISVRHQQLLVSHSLHSLVVFLAQVLTEVYVFSENSLLQLCALLKVDEETAFLSYYWMMLTPSSCWECTYMALLKQ